MTLPQTVNSAVNGIAQFILKRRRPFSLPVGEAHRLPACFHLKMVRSPFFFVLSRSNLILPTFSRTSETSIIYKITLGFREFMARLRSITSTNNIDSSLPLLDVSTQ